MINLVTQTAFDFAEPFVLSANAQVGYQALNEKYPIRGDASAGGRFGGDEQFGILIGGSYSNRDFQGFGIFTDDGAAFPGVAGSEECRVGTECGSQGTTRGYTTYYKQNNITQFR